MMVFGFPILEIDSMRPGMRGGSIRMISESLTNRCPNIIQSPSGSGVPHLNTSLLTGENITYVKKNHPNIKMNNTGSLTTQDKLEQLECPLHKGSCNEGISRNSLY